MKFRQSVLSISMILSMTAAGTASADLGNRYGLPQIYQSEISAAYSAQPDHPFWFYSIT
jgi:hypothetical protein